MGKLRYGGQTGRPLNKWTIPTVFCAFILAVISIFPLGNGLALGSDEGFELAKSFLNFNGFHLYSQIWSDQPPLYTQWLSVLFKIAGPSIFAARLLTVILSALLLMAIYEVVHYCSGPWAAIGAVVLLASAPAYLALSVSVMQEIPAFSLGMASVWVLFHWERSNKGHWLPISGALMTCALLIKFTAGLLLPAIGFEILLASYNSEAKGKTMLANLGLWAIGALGALGLLVSVLDLGSFMMLVGTHTHKVVIAGMSKPSDFVFPIAPLFREHWEVHVCALIGLWILFKRKLWREAAFPLVMLATVTMVHLFHSPWWYYYYLHHAIPLAWLSGITVREAITYLQSPRRHTGQSLVSPIVAELLLAVVVVKSGVRIVGEIRQDRESEKVYGNAMVEHIVKYREQTHWFYAQPVIYAFHARLPCPPELAVVTRKRYWSGQMTWQKLLETVEHYQPEQMLLFKSAMGPEWTEFLESNYWVDYDDGQEVLYIAKTLKKPSP